MVEVWWSLLGAVIPAIVGGQALRVKRKRFEEQRIKSARGRRVQMTFLSARGSVHQRECWRKWVLSLKIQSLILVLLFVECLSLMLALMRVLALSVLISIRYQIGTTFAFVGVKVSALSYLLLILPSAFFLFLMIITVSIISNVLRSWWLALWGEM